LPRAGPTRAPGLGVSDVTPPSVLPELWSSEMLRLLREADARLRRVEREIEEQGGDLAALTRAGLDRQPVMFRIAELAKESDEWSGQRRDLYRKVLESVAELMVSWPMKVSGAFVVFAFGAVLIARVAGIEVESVDLAAFWPGSCPP
jgi:hypothetical protein